MDYLSDVLTDPLFADWVIGGLLIFGTFGLWRFFQIYILLIVITFNDLPKMKTAMIVMIMVMSFHYAVSLLGSRTKSPFRDVTE
jgi:hypothetical protein